MKRKSFYPLVILFILYFGSSAAMAQSGKISYKITIPGFSAITATDCALVPVGAGGVVTITKSADKQDQQFQNDMKNKTKIATMDVVSYDGGGKKIKSYHFINLQVQSAAANYQGISSFGLSFDNETEK